MIVSTFKKFVMSILVLGCILVPFKVHAFQITDNQSVDSHKSWTITFTDEVGFDDITKSAIRVVENKSGIAVDNITIKQGSDAKVILVEAPQEGYTPGANYTLTVDTKAHSKKSKKLSLVRAIHFSIKTSNNEIATFPDKNLQQIIREAINKPTGDIYKSDLESIDALYAGNKAINNLSGIENLINLRQLYLSYNNINNITLIRELKNLRVLYLDGNAISDISSLGNLTNLQQLNLDDNQISDISALKNLTSLSNLYVQRNNVMNLDPLGSLTKLNNLGLTGNRIVNIDSLSNLTGLITLTLDNNFVKDISPLSNLYSLTMLRLYNNQISDISGLKGLVNLKKLTLGNNSIKDYSPVSSYYYNLQEVDFSLNK